MSAPTLRRPAPHPSGPSRPRPSGLTWAVLRLHRAALLLWGGFLLVTAVVLAWMYVIAPEARAAAGPVTSEGTYRTGTALVSTALSYLMFPVAAWAGGALTGRELEDGTAHLAWTQSVSPARWLAVKLAVPAAALTAGTTLAVLLLGWARRGGDPRLVDAWYDPDVHLALGPAAVAHVLAGLALGALAGLVLRRALPAAAVAFALTLVVHEVLEAYRPSLWPASTVTGRAALALPPDALDLEHGAVTTDGQRIGNDLACVGSQTPAQVRTCMKEAGLSDFWASYHPRSHLWPLQLVESGVLLAVAGAATAAAFALLRRRTA
ncbi:hypothetical protein AB0912_09820 [Streptomyces sp. NPDC007084]|uniref:hypothetical protein n=1 Tax=Streptomyces sp. NPDC007084 TaxID=3154313 RepID=UPI0034569042